MIWIIAIVVAVGLASPNYVSTQDAIHAQDISGDWQGNLKVSATASLRIVLHITKSDNGG